jgi:hypothetical protein
MSVEIRKYVHVFMWNADDVDTVGNAKIEHEVLAFRKLWYPSAISVRCIP